MNSPMLLLIVNGWLGILPAARCSAFRVQNSGTIAFASSSVILFLFL